MALDTTRFDELLKERAWRDLAFRALVWFGISAVAAYLALHRGVSAVNFLERVASSMGPLVNLIGTFAVLLAMPALAFKDLEFVAPDKWGQSTRRGKLGGVARRLAGDLLLWTLGAFSTLLSAIVVAIFIEGVAEGERGSVRDVVAKLALVTLITALLAIGVRRKEPSPLVEVTKRINPLTALYTAIVAISVLAVMRSA